MKKTNWLGWTLVLICLGGLIACTDQPTSAPTDTVVTTTAPAHTLDSSASVDNTTSLSTTNTPITDEPAQCQHVPVTDKAVPATCKSTGLTEGSHCSICQTVLVAQSETPKADHTPVIDAAIPASCTHTGLTEGSHCSVCQDIIVEQQILPQTEHQYVEGKCTCGATAMLAMKLSDDEGYYIVTGIGTYQGQTLVIPDTYEGKPVKAIHSAAFSGNKTIQHIVMGANITDIDSYAFQNCTALQSVRVTSLEAWLSITFWNSYSNPLNYAHDLYIGDQLLTDLVIPDDMTSIGRWTFIGCTSIQSLTVGQRVTQIKYAAFHSCSNLTEIRLNEKLEKIDSYAFFGCNKLESELHFPNSLTAIGDYAFANNGKLAGVTFGNALSSIGQAAFQNCAKFTTLTIPASVTYIGKYAFQNCSGVQGVIFENITGWQCVHASYPTSNMGEAALSYAPGAANFLTNLYTDREWRHE